MYPDFGGERTRKLMKSAEEHRVHKRQKGVYIACYGEKRVLGFLSSVPFAEIRIGIIE